MKEESLVMLTSGYDGFNSINLLISVGQLEFHIGP